MRDSWAWICGSWASCPKVQQPPNQPYDLYIWEGKIDHFRINSSLVALWFGLVESPMMPRWTSQDVTGVKSWFFMWAMADCGGGIYYPIYRGSIMRERGFLSMIIIDILFYPVMAWQVETHKYPILIRFPLHPSSSQHIYPIPWWELRRDHRIPGWKSRISNWFSCMCNICTYIYIYMWLYEIICIWLYVYIDIHIHMIMYM